MNIGFFVTCLADWVRPNVAISAVKVLQAYGCTVSVPKNQTCCGQPAYNSGDRDSARAVATTTINALMGHDYIVIPSGSCTGMIRKHYPELFKDDKVMLEKIAALDSKIFEFTQFLIHVLKVDDKTLPDCLKSESCQRFSGSITYHDSCSGLRELGIKKEPRALINMVAQQSNTANPPLIPLQGEEECCGFGGAFAAKYGEISSAIAHKKCEAIIKTKADAVILGDAGCMQNIEGALRANDQSSGKKTRVLHIAEYLAGER